MVGSWPSRGADAKRRWWGRCVGRRAACRHPAAPRTRPPLASSFRRSGHCKKLAPIWEEVGRELAGDGGVVVAKLDATANDVPSPKISVRGYPTLVFVTAKGDVIPYGWGGGVGRVAWLAWAEAWLRWLRTVRLWSSALSLLLPAAVLPTTLPPPSLRPFLQGPPREEGSAQVHRRQAHHCGQGRRGRGGRRGGGCGGGGGEGGQGRAVSGGWMRTR